VAEAVVVTVVIVVITEEASTGPTTASVALALRRRPTTAETEEVAVATEEVVIDAPPTALLLLLLPRTAEDVTTETPLMSCLTLFATRVTVVVVTEVAEAVAVDTTRFHSTPSHLTHSLTLFGLFSFCRFVVDTV